MEANINFTEREKECLGLIIKGCSTNEMAKIMHCSTHTVKVYMTNLFRKTNSINRANLIYRLCINGYFKF